jgi:hypothetical protein
MRSFLIFHYDSWPQCDILYKTFTILSWNQHKFFTYIPYNTFKTEEIFLENQQSQKRRYIMNSNLRQKFFTGATVLLLGFFMLITTQAFADNGYKGKGKEKEWQKQKEQEKEYRKHREEMEREDRKHYEEQERESRKHREEMEREDRKHYEEQGRRDYKKGSDYHEHRGYRDRPYDKSRHYDHYNHKGHRYEYQGHWRSWDQWDMYAKKHPQIYKHGTYYREGAHLMFKFCDPGTGNCFFFSIGG